jgi:hypothetical protein
LIGVGGEKVMKGEEGMGEEVEVRGGDGGRGGWEVVVR